MKNADFCSERPGPEEPPGGSSLSTYLAPVFTVVVVLVLNSLGCYLAVRWKRRRSQTGSGDWP